MIPFLLVFLGGGLGSLCRYGLSLWLKPHTIHLAGLPIHTLAANLCGCLLIGILLGHFAKHPDSQLPLLMVTGFCGGFTTFSTFSSECVAMLRNGQTGLALAYIAISLMLCLAATAAGIALCKE